MRHRCKENIYDYDINYHPLDKYWFITFERFTTRRKDGQGEFWNMIINNCPFCGIDLKEYRMKE